MPRNASFTFTSPWQRACVAMVIFKSSEAGFADWSNSGAWLWHHCLLWTRYGGGDGTPWPKVAPRRWWRRCTASWAASTRTEASQTIRWSTAPKWTGRSPQSSLIVATSWISFVLELIGRSAERHLETSSPPIIKVLRILGNAETFLQHGAYGNHFLQLAI